MSKPSLISRRTAVGALTLAILGAGGLLMGASHGPAKVTDTAPAASQATTVRTELGPDVVFLNYTHVFPNAQPADGAESAWAAHAP